MIKGSIRGVIVFALLGASMASAQSSQAARDAFTLVVNPGPQYRVLKTLFWFIKIPAYPQMACWIETEDGKYVQAVYVTAGEGKNRYSFAPRNGRPEALPAWSHRKGPGTNGADAVSGATPAAASERTASVAPAAGLHRVVVFLEVNRAFDYNERYTRSNSGVNGQPSVIYKTELDLSKGPVRSRFVPYGTGAVDGSDGSITPGSEGITTALTIVDSVEIVFGPK